MLRPGLDLLRKTGDILGNTERGVVCHPIRRTPCCWSFLLEGSMPSWIAGPELSGWLGEILTHRGAWAQLASARTNDGPRCLANVRAIIHSQPASCQPEQPTATAAGGFLPPAYASQTVSHVVARVRYRRGRQPLQLTRIVSLLLSALGYVHYFPCSAGHASAQFS